MKKLLQSLAILTLVVVAPVASAAVFSTTADGDPAQFVGDTYVYHVQYKKDHTEVANTIGFELHFDPKMLEVDSISSEKTLIDLWVQRPRYDNERGIVEMSGGGFNIDRDQRLLTIEFTALKPGLTELDFQNIQVYANDGRGTPIRHQALDGKILIVEPPVSADEEQIKRSSSVLILIALIITLFFPFVLAYFFFFDRLRSSREGESE